MQPATSIRFRKQIFEEYAKDPVMFARDLLAAGLRVERRRAQWLKAKNKQLAKQKK